MTDDAAAALRRVRQAMPEPAETVRRIREALDRPLPHRTEAELQDAIVVRLASAGLPVIRENVLGAAGRIDFTVDRVGVEVKIKGPVSEVQRQLDRYADSGMVEELMLVTTNPRHRAVRRTSGRQRRIHTTVMRLPWM